MLNYQKHLLISVSVVTKLSETIPTLMKKLDELQNQSIQMPNISENINRIRQLIQQARNAANKVSIISKDDMFKPKSLFTPPCNGSCCVFR